MLRIHFQFLYSLPLAVCECFLHCCLPHVFVNIRVTARVNSLFVFTCKVRAFSLVSAPLLVNIAVRYMQRIHKLSSCLLCLHNLAFTDSYEYFFKTCLRIFLVSPPALKALYIVNIYIIIYFITSSQTQNHVVLCRITVQSM